MTITNEILMIEPYNEAYIVSFGKKLTISPLTLSLTFLAINAHWFLFPQRNAIHFLRFLSGYFRFSMGQEFYALKKNRSFFVRSIKMYLIVEIITKQVNKIKYSIPSVFHILIFMVQINIHPLGTASLKQIKRIILGCNQHVDVHRFHAAYLSQK